MEHVEIKTEELADLQDEVETCDDIFGQSLDSQPSQDDNYDDGDDFILDGSITSNSRRATWPDSYCKILLNLYKEEHPNVGKTNQVKTKRMLWERIAKRMREHGARFSAMQVEAKFKSLKRAHNNLIANRQAGKAKTYTYEEDLYEMFLGQTPTTSTQHTEEIHNECFVPIAGHSEEEDKVRKIVLRDRILSSDEESLLSIGSVSYVSRDDGETLENIKEQDDKSTEANSVAEELRKWRKIFVKEAEAKKKYRNAKLKAYLRRTVVLEKQLKYKQQLLLAFMKSQNGRKEK